MTHPRHREAPWSRRLDLGDHELAANVAFAVAAVPSATFAAILAA